MSTYDPIKKREYYKKNKEKIDKNRKENYIKNRKVILEKKHEYYNINKKRILKQQHERYLNIREKILKKQKNLRAKSPWMITLINVKQRCTNKNKPDYKYYGGRGIKCLITKEEIKKLWFRDKAWLLKKPSIDRIDNDGNYTYENCRFIEQTENSIKSSNKPILQFDLEGNFIREWVSITEASKCMKTAISNLSHNLHGKNETAKGFVWKFKNV